MNENRYRSMSARFHVNRRSFLKVGGAVGAGLALGTPPVFGQDAKEEAPAKPWTNVGSVLGAPKTEHSLPGPFPGRVVEVHDPASMTDDGAVAPVVAAMFRRGVKTLTGEGMGGSFARFFTKEDVVGIKVNPVGAGLISTRLELVDAIVAWLEEGGIPRRNIVIWDRFEGMLREAGFTEERYPGVRIEGLQMMDESAASGESEDDSGWRDENGVHRSAGRFDMEVFYRADVEAPEDDGYLNQHVVNGRDSYFGKIVTKDLTKIINVPVFKNTGNGVSMATKNLGYGAICNTGRLHRPLFFDVCTEVLAFPAIRDKLVLNVTDGLRAQYDGGPMPNAQATWLYHRIFFATDPFALDMVCHDLMVAKRKEMGIEVNEHPRYSEYLRYAEKLGLGVADPGKTEFVRV
ncbi:MAG: DUF362 domain-containing protein [Candidatus Eisenbacteria bacterium]